MVQIGLTIRMCLFTRRSLVLFPGCDVSISMDIRPVDEVLFEELSQSQYRQRTGAGGIGATRIRRERRENKRSVLMRRWHTTEVCEHLLPADQAMQIPQSCGTYNRTTYFS